MSWISFVAGVGLIGRTLRVCDVGVEGVVAEVELEELGVPFWGVGNSLEAASGGVSTKDAFLSRDFGREQESFP